MRVENRDIFLVKCLYTFTDSRLDSAGTESRLPSSSPSGVICNMHYHLTPLTRNNVVVAARSRTSSTMKQSYYIDQNSSQRRADVFDVIELFISTLFFGSFRCSNSACNCFLSVLTAAPSLLVVIPGMMICFMIYAGHHATSILDQTGYLVQSALQ